MDHWEYLIGLGIQTILFLGGGYAMVLKNKWNNEYPIILVHGYMGYAPDSSYFFANYF